MAEQITTEKVYEWLEAVKDPEIPVLSLVDLGVITDLHIQNNCIKITLTPTFVGCPALDMMRSEIQEVLRQHGADEVVVDVSFHKPWSSDMISEKGKLALKKFGLAPPPAGNLLTDLDILEHVICPRCNGDNTELRNSFGPTLCRSIHYCFSCREAFEQFKPL
jgi:ring-1,2-phenylacetyl-CoA epoxidase subunit PaaD